MVTLICRRLSQVSIVFFWIILGMNMVVGFVGTS